MIFAGQHTVEWSAANYSTVAFAPGASYQDYEDETPELNFPPNENYRTRAVARYNAETQAIDVSMFRIADRAQADAIITATRRGVPVRLITDPAEYRNPDRLWHSYNVDRMYRGGVSIKFSVGGLQTNTIYYWKVVSRTMANETATSATWRDWSVVGGSAERTLTHGYLNLFRIASPACRVPSVPPASRVISRS